MAELERNLCLLPWVQATVFHDGKFSVCCHAKLDFQDLDQVALEEGRNSEAVKGLRLAMMKGEAPAPCAYCYRSEQAGSPSPRTLANRRFAGESARIPETLADGSVSSPLRSLEVRFSNVCNLRCRTCSPRCSTSWYADARALGEPVPAGPVRLGSSSKEEILAALPGVDLLYFAGGEPTFDESHYELLDALLARGRTDLTLEYNTNFTTLRWGDRDLLALWKRFRSVRIGASLDGAGAQFEYLRKGARWPAILENHARLGAEVPDALFYIHCTVSAMNVFHLPEAFAEWLGQGLLRWPDQLVLNFLEEPEHLQMSILDDEERRRLSERYASAKFPASTHLSVRKALERALRTVLGRLESQPFTPDRLATRRRFRERTLRLDSLRGERFEELFPELATLMRPGS